MLADIAWYEAYPVCSCFAVDGCIHRASGPCLYAECRSLNGCSTGQAKITCGYELPAKFISLSNVEPKKVEDHLLPYTCPRYLFFEFLI
uniref:Macro domain-containing protein n=1 Tax=Leptobrachium leishanense TaxID=445787 RepID=A0A8C5M3J0_9ANUR